MSKLMLGRAYITKPSQLICFKYDSIKLYKPNARTLCFVIIWRKHLFRTQSPFFFSVSR